MRAASLFLFTVLPTFLNAAPPTVIDSRLTLELVAGAPDIVTPTGLAIDSRGRIWCLENHTHQRTPAYKGPPTDRVRVFEDFDEHGRARKIWTFAEGFRNSMGLAFGRDGILYLATRDAIHRLPIKDDREAGRTIVVKLETKGDYPHNGLSGFAWDLNGDLIFGLGENLGESYKLIGSDGTTLSGGGEGGSMYRCRPDGSHLSRIATGFWNPFAHCVDSMGRLFAVDNDPDARGPCRLIHVVQGGDYGYRFRYGRKGNHPFQCWNGELPGTLPMVAGTSEAPSGVLEYEQSYLPDDYSGKLFVTSWGDHTIEAFELSPRGASYSAKAKTVVRGDENFRPVAIAIAPDGSLVFNDWVDKSYPVHGKGRIWRLRAKEHGKHQPTVRFPRQLPEEDWYAIAKNDSSPAKRMQAILMLKSPRFTSQFIPTLGDSDPFLAGAAITALGRPGQSKLLLEALRQKPEPPIRLGLLLALRRTGDADASNSLEQFLADPDPGIRRAAIQWVAEEKLTQFAERLAAAASKPPVTAELFEAWLAARELLAGKKPGGPRNLTGGEDYAAEVLKDAGQPVLFRRLALRSLRPDHPLLTAGFLSTLLQLPDQSLRQELVRTLVVREDAAAQSLLRKIAVNNEFEVSLRALAITGLGHSSDAKSTQTVLETVISTPELRTEAERSLGKLAPKPKRTIDEWRALLKDNNGDARAGERIFFQPRGPGCYKCHRVDNRGGMVGPDLSFIARSANRDKLIESILEPSKEIAPMFTAWKVLTRDGKERIGLILGETFDSFVLVGDAQGKIERIHRTQIEERTAQTKSLMPDDLAQQMSQREFLDLLTFLLERR